MKVIERIKEETVTLTKTQKAGLALFEADVQAAMRRRNDFLADCLLEQVGEVGEKDQWVFDAKTLSFTKQNGNDKA